MKKENNINSDTSHEIIDNTAPLLSNINKNIGFVVPNGYFEQLSSEIQQQCINSSKESWIKSILFSFTKPKFILRYSFTLVLLTLGAYFLLQINNSNTNTKGISSYSINEHDTIIDLIVNEEIDESELTDALANNSEIELQPINTIDNSQLNSNDIINYLIEDSEDNYDYIY